eukprot:30069-Chlamydomonas_euryale.AAC.1
MAITGQNVPAEKPGNPAGVWEQHASTKSLLGSTVTRCLVKHGQHCSNVAKRGQTRSHMVKRGHTWSTTLYHATPCDGPMGIRSECAPQCPQRIPHTETHLLALDTKSLNPRHLNPRHLNPGHLNPKP